MSMQYKIMSACIMIKHIRQRFLPALYSDCSGFRAALYLSLFEGCCHEQSLCIIRWIVKCLSYARTIQSTLTATKPVIWILNTSSGLQQPPHHHHTE